jgi:hypothetical protein
MPKSKGLTKEAEASILSAVTDVCGHVDDGLSPTAALRKVAEASDFPPDMIRLIAIGYNTGAANHQRETQKTAMLKFAAVPLADADSVVSELYPSQVKSAAEAYNSTAVSDEYSRAPRGRKITNRISEKVASDREDLFRRTIKKPEAYRPEDLRAKHAFEGLQRRKQQLEIMRGKVSHARDQFLTALDKFASEMHKAVFFKTANMAEVNFLAEQLFGQPGKLAVKMAYDHFGGKKIPDPVPNKTPADLTQEPLRSLSLAVEKGAAYSRLDEEYRRAQEKASRESLDSVREFFTPPERPVGSSILASRQRKEAEAQKKNAEKQASGLVGMLIASNAAKNLMSDAAKPPETSSLVNKYTEELGDPQHENELRAIQAETMLQDFINNDEVLSGYQPDRILTAYNELSQLSPRAANQPAVMRPLLRKYMAAGGLEPFESREMADIEKTMAQSSSPQFMGASGGGKPGF